MLPRDKKKHRKKDNIRTYKNLERFCNHKINRAVTTYYILFIYMLKPWKLAFLVYKHSFFLLWNVRVFEVFDAFTEIKILIYKITFTKNYQDRNLDDEKGRLSEDECFRNEWHCLIWCFKNIPDNSNWITSFKTMMFSFWLFWNSIMGYNFNGIWLLVVYFTMVI